MSSFNALASGSFARNASEVTPRKFAPKASAVVDVIASAILRGEVFNFASETTTGAFVRVSSSRSNDDDDDDDDDENNDYNTAKTTKRRKKTSSESSSPIAVCVLRGIFALSEVLMWICFGEIPSLLLSVNTLSER